MAAIVLLPESFVNRGLSKCPQCFELKRPHAKCFNNIWPKGIFICKDCADRASTRTLELARSKLKTIPPPDTAKTLDQCGSCTEWIVKYMQLQDRPVNVAEVHQYSGYNRENVKKSFYVLKSKGVVRSIHRGLYELTGEPFIRWEYNGRLPTIPQTILKVMGQCSDLTLGEIQQALGHQLNYEYDSQKLGRALRRMTDAGVLARSRDNRNAPYRYRLGNVENCAESLNQE